MADKKRNLENKLNELLKFFPVIIILGVRQCGKTTLARMLRPTWRYYDLERHQDYNLIAEDFEFFIKENPHSVIIDEAQRYPQLFQELRGVIDADRRKKNRFILTGSSSLELIKNVSESLAGRVGIIELGTFKINEIYDLPLPDFYTIFKQKINDETKQWLKNLKQPVNHDQMMAIFLKGGYPEPVLENSDRFFQSWMENYYQTYVQRDIRSLFPRLDLVKYQRFISMLSSLNGTIINRSQVSRSLDVSEKSIRDYLDIASGSYIWRNIHSFEKSVSKSVIKMPRGNFRDSGFSHYIQGIRNRDQLIKHPAVGSSFEAFITEEVIKGVQALDAAKVNYYYFRTRNGAEIDLILEGDFGVLPFEIKFGSFVKRRQIQTLKAFVEKNDLPLGIVINNSDRVEMISEKIIQLPSTYI
ncbi:MAG: ATP-binding protein [Deltaproteobacteria bacterium]|jgi:uncharacterized protein|nr:ATP-binding protein [Deltaproteobacteria bacterium]MBT7483795.1 ATP-binding protein [Candidatus Peregrinibacteria bacterium]MBT4091078.1 ATP-binding protein [Deltaproteobacteria bacterium]MBT4264112.1 ATP-binding protein [Deltaproteobacteria bacterium]MBT4641995.1 ATP-binding protein [Deltaproteobacteria bacterium]